MFSDIESFRQQLEQLAEHNEKENMSMTMDGYEYPQGCSSARVILVIETKATRGSGKNPGDPAREVTEFWDLGGKKLAECDPYWRSMPRASSNASSDST